MNLAICCPKCQRALQARASQLDRGSLTVTCPDCDYSKTYQAPPKKTPEALAASTPGALYTPKTPARSKRHEP